MSRRSSRSSDMSKNAEFGQFTLLFAEDGNEMYQEFKRTPVKTFVLQRSRCRSDLLYKTPKW